jgi:hypothetical protein
MYIVVLSFIELLVSFDFQVEQDYEFKCFNVTQIQFYLFWWKFYSVAIQEIMLPLQKLLYLSKPHLYM